MLVQTKAILFCIAAGMCMTESLFAQTLHLDLSPDVTLSSLTQTVYERHPAHHNALAQQQQINANTDLASATFANVNSININHYNDFIDRNDGTQEWEGSVNMPLWLPGQKQQQLLLSDKLSAELPAYKQQIRLDSSAQVRELIWQVILADNVSTQAYQVWQTSEALENDVAIRVKAGELASTEQLLANTNSLEMHSHYLLANAELEYALSRYQYITGESSLPQHYEEALPASYSNRQQSHSEAVIGQNHPSLLLLEQKINTLRTQQDIAQYNGAVNPSLSVGIRSEREQRGDNFNNSAGVGISFALDNDVYRRPAIAKAAKQLANTEITRQKLERELNISLFSQLHDLETKQQQLVLVNQQNESTQQYYVLQQRAFELGEIDLVNLLRSQSLANQTQNKQQALEIDIKHIIAMTNQALGLIL